MAKRKLINLENRRAELEREMREIEDTQKAASAILKVDLPTAKSKVYDHIATLADLGVAENYNHTLLHICADRGDEGARLPLLRKVLTDQVSLDDARHELGSDNYNVVENGKTVEKTGAGHLREKSDGNAITIYITTDGKAAFEAAKKAAVAKK